MSRSARNHSLAEQLRDDPNPWLPARLLRAVLTICVWRLYGIGLVSNEAMKARRPKLSESASTPFSRWYWAPWHG
jgi:hypothetical protein